MWAICHLLTERHIQVVTTCHHYDQGTFLEKFEPGLKTIANWAWLIRSHKFSGNKSTDIKLADPLFHLLICTYTSFLSVIQLYIYLCVLYYIFFAFRQCKHMLYLCKSRCRNGNHGLQDFVEGVLYYCNKKESSPCFVRANPDCISGGMCRFTTSP